MTTGEGSFATSQHDGPRFENLPERRFGVREHHGGVDTIDDTRRPVYQHMIMHELVAGPSILRFRDDAIDVMVGCAAGFTGMDDLTLYVEPAGRYALLDYEGPEKGLAGAHERLRRWVASEGAIAEGALLQVHMMDPMDDGMVEQQLQIRVKT
jgi:hypothetical protein